MTAHSTKRKLGDVQPKPEGPALWESPRVWIATLVLLVVCLARLWHVDALLRLNEGHVDGWIAVMETRIALPGNYQDPGRLDVERKAMVLQGSNPRRSPIVFTEFTGGVFDRLLASAGPRRPLPGQAPRRILTMGGGAPTPAHRRAGDETILADRVLYGRIRYAGFGRRVVYDFEKLDPRDEP